MDPKEAARQKIQALVERFEEQKDFYYRSEYNETATRRDFIDPFFKALGWDVANEKGYAETYREVIHEDRVKDRKRNNGRSTFPDYSFRLAGGKRLFFVEAKKPSVYIKQQVTPAFQVRTYGWSAGLPISIITDFEEFAVYDCTKKPRPNDKADTARLKYIKYEDYLKEFDFIWNTFSKERVLKGSFDRFVDDEDKKGSTPVDVDFLNSLTRWRKLLATDIVNNHPGINESDLTFAVQEIINRIVFLRIAEDRDVERYGYLKEALHRDNYYQNLLYIFSQANEKYNAEFFSLGSNDITHTLKIDNRTIKAIINNLYFPDSSYAFAVIPIEIMGTAYEQFLGKCIRITAGHRAKIEDKPEVRKAGGVYYTPQYIVDYIVEKTIKPLVEGKTPKEIAKIKIIDPACGSGSFLIRAYQFLLDYHRDYYLKNSKISRNRKDSPLTPDGYLTSEVKKRILLNNIYGVDIDRNAVQVTKMALLLKCMEGETLASIETQLQLFHEPILPAMHNNIKTGNSLVDTDYYDSEPDIEEAQKISPFNWKKAFPEVFRQGGFDAVIGNPPYVVMEGELKNDKLISYFRKNYEAACYKIDLYHLLMQKGIQLMKDKGRLGFITPSNYLANTGLSDLRNIILSNTRIDILNIIEGRVFEGASVDTAITILNQGNTSGKSMLIRSRWRFKQLETVSQKEFKQAAFRQNEGQIFTSVNGKTKFKAKTYLLNEKYWVKFGMQLRDREVFKSDVITRDQKKLITSYHKPCYTGKDVKPYFLKYNNLLAYFNKEAKRGGCWDENIHFANPKIIIRQIGTYPICSLDELGYCCLNTVFMIVPKEKTAVDLKFILGILNSKTIANYWQENYSDKRQTFPKIKGSYLEKLPLPAIDLKNKASKQLHDEIVKCVDKLLKLYKDQYQERMLSSMVHREPYIERCEDKINQLVYKLYNLSEEDIEIIERSFEKTYPVTRQ